MKGLKEIIAAILLGAVLPGLLLQTAEAPNRDRVEPITISVLHGDTVMAMDMNDYLTGVLLAEMLPEFHMEALKALSVAARTFALHGQRHPDAAVCTSANCCQGYIDPEEYLRNGGDLDVVTKMRTAVRDTDNKVLYYNGMLIESTYFASSGGRTEDAKEVWGADVPYLRSVESGEANTFCEIIMRKEAFLEKLGLTGKEVDIGRPAYTRGGGVSIVEINQCLFTGTQLRSLLNLRSTNISFDVQAEGVRIVTNGHGHRVGMSQYGADAMAEQGSGYIEILTHYYTGVTIRNYA